MRVRVTFEDGSIINRSIGNAARALRVCYPREFSSIEQAKEKLLRENRIEIKGRVYQLLRRKTHPHHYTEQYDRILIKIAKHAEQFPRRNYSEVKRDIKNLQRAYNALMKYIYPTLEGYKLR